MKADEAMGAKRREKQQNSSRKKSEIGEGAEDAVQKAAAGGISVSQCGQATEASA